MKISGHGIEFGSKKSKACLINKVRKSSSETSNGHGLDDVPSDGNNEVITVPMNAEKPCSHKRMVARYASLKLNGVQDSQGSRRQRQNLSPNIEASNATRFKPLLEEQ